MDAVTLAAARAATSRTLKPLRRRDLPGHAALPTLMTSPPTVTQGSAGGASAISGSALIPPWDTSAFTYFGTTPGFGGAGFPGNGWYQSNAQAATGQNVYSGTSPSPWAIDFDFDTFDGKFEVRFTGKGGGSGIRVLVNGQYATQLSTFVSATADSQPYLGLVNLGSTPGTYRIRFECEANTAFMGIQTHPLNGVSAPAKRRMQRWIIMGDSFTEPTFSESGSPRTVTDGVTTSGSAVLTSATGAFTAADYGKTVTGTGIPANTVILQAGLTSTSVTLSNQATATATGVSVTITGGKHAWDAYPQQLSYMLGADVWSAGLGGTGWLKVNGGSQNFLTRIADVTNNKPDVVVFAGGINDYSSFTAAQIQTQAVLCIQAVQAAVPGVQVIVMSPYTGRGFQSYPANFLATTDGLKAAAAATGATFVDVLRLPAPTTGANGGPAPAPTTLSASTIVGNTQITTPVLYPLGTHMQIGTGTNAEVRKVTGTSGSSNPYTLQFGGGTPGGGGGGLSNVHTAGEAILPVGPGISSGSGSQSSLQGDGTSDRYTGTDGTHPTVAGHRSLGRGIFRELAAKLAA